MPEWNKFSDGVDKSKQLRDMLKDPKTQKADLEKWLTPPPAVGSGTATGTAPTEPTTESGERTARPSVPTIPQTRRRNVHRD